MSMLGGAEWHAAHVEEVLEAPARNAELPPPSLERFEAQLRLEARCRQLALGDYRRDVEYLSREGRLESSLAARRLLDTWMPKLTQAIQDEYDKFTSLDAHLQAAKRGPRKAKAASKPAPAPGEGDAAPAAAGAAPAPAAPDPTAAAAGGGDDADAAEHAPLVRDLRGPGGAAAAVSRMLREQRQQQGRAAAAGGSGAAESAASSIKDLGKWVPLVLPVPAPMLARAMIASLLNTLCSGELSGGAGGSEGTDLPSGMAYSVDAVDNMGRRVMDMVSYIKVCEMVQEQRRAAVAAARALRQAQRAAGVAEAVAESPRTAVLESERMVAEVLADGVPVGAEAAVRRAAGLTPLARVGGHSRDRASRGGMLLRRLDASLALSERLADWDQATRVQVGAHLVQMALKTLKVPPQEEEEDGAYAPRTEDGGAVVEGGAAAGAAAREPPPAEPAFLHSTSAARSHLGGGVQTPGLVVMHPALMRRLEGDQELRSLLRPRLMPMLVEPRPWSGVRFGGLLTQTAPVMKTRYSPTAGGAPGAGDVGGHNQPWWMRGEKPWQLLAACMDVAAALECSGGPAAYVSYQPVNQDGTCNGLQHYAALGRDRRGGAEVNLVCSDRPRDVYTAVANAVAERVERDRAAGLSEAAKAHGTVDRKLVKQTVMTYVYGVTIVGAREQIESRLEERGWGSARERRKVATYLARATFESMGDVFGSAVKVRSWLEECAKVGWGYW
ncbi:hypothetical protein GPECTOR_279g736 [Gonium pectorale]|uniref:DNA-directed RNA polymerase n=1 Tax=Gonium pectorale TaxID=33097 RepID=A0A150FW14_GONPE|nr:hypothetical protein GPECTOR_279g736 [Gonium pectorale]|eukprot:KXZ41801.1 hypothetical protein GPECTOR_279g736 [Gonium pectorale]